MSQRLYDLATAKALMRFAYPEYREQDPKPYEIRENGVFATDAFRDVCPPGTIFDWTPADEMGWPGSPNPDTAPFLPIPFDAAQLAAAMIDGPGQSIAHAMEHRLGYPLAGDALSRFSDRMMWMRDAVAEAYAAAAAAQSVIGEFDHDQENRAHAMAQQYEEANEQANDREGVFEQGITRNEASARRARAAASVADLKAQAEGAQAAVAEKWKAWRKAMVRQLLWTDSRRSYIAGRLEEMQTEWKGLPTAQIAVIFDGLPYTAENWLRRASDTHWVQKAKLEQGAAGGATSLWCPATLARLIHGRNKGAAKQKTLEALNKRFKNNPALEPWRDAWNQHYEMFNDAD